MTRKMLKLLFIFFILFTLVGCNNVTKEDEKNNLKNVEIIIYDKEDNKIYDEKKDTDSKYLIDVLKSIEELELKTENGDYGEYIISIKGLSQENDYYWNYYVNDEYAQVGVSSYEIKDKDEFAFKLEKFE